MDTNRKPHEFDRYNDGPGEDPLAPARGVMGGVACGLVAWFICGVVFYLTFFR